MTVWFTSDWHLGHEAIIKFCNRPYTAAEEMNWDIIRNVNAICASGDILYHLGDISFMHSAYTAELLRYVKPQIHLILGNHDRTPKPETKNLYAWVGHYKRITVDDQKIVLCHYPIESWHGMHRGAWMLHGHSHGGLRRLMRNRVDVGVDCFDMRPVSFEELRQHPNMQRNFEPADHHE